MARERTALSTIRRDMRRLRKELTALEKAEQVLGGKRRKRTTRRRRVKRNAVHK